MKSLFNFKMTTRLLVGIFPLVCLALSQIAQAVVPAPDGGYPSFNTAEGTNALKNLTTGVGNAAVGGYSLFSNTDGSFNTALGAGTLLSNIGDQSTLEGTQNTAIGTVALLFNTTGRMNTATGSRALFSNTTGNFNTATGDSALVSNTIGGFNTAIGEGALFSNTTGYFNTAIGESAGHNQTTGSHNVYIGAGTSAEAGESNACRIGSIFGQTSMGGTQVFIDVNNKLGTMTSSRRFKEEIKPIGAASDELYALQPVTFHYKSDAKGTPQFGLIAEEVAKVNPALVLPDKEGKPYTVRYDAVNAMLLNEFLKEHQEVEQLRNHFEATVAQQQKEIAALTATVKEQAAQIEKVSTQVEINRLARQIVRNYR
jgi:Chaperone of endosialidase